MKRLKAVFDDGTEAYTMTKVDYKYAIRSASGHIYWALTEENAKRRARYFIAGPCDIGRVVVPSPTPEAPVQTFTATFRDGTEATNTIRPYTHALCVWFPSGHHKVFWAHSLHLAQRRQKAVTVPGCPSEIVEVKRG